MSERPTESSFASGASRTAWPQRWQGMMKARLREIAETLGYEIRRHPSGRHVDLLHQFGVDLVLDVGAASGGYASQLRRRGYSGRIVSFEPLSKPYHELEARAANDDLWNVMQIALGDRAGRTTIHVAGNSDSSSVLPMLDRHTEAAPHTAYVGREQIEMTRLDDLLESVIEDSHRPLLKLDVQGYELNVLRGAALSLPELVGIQVEVSFVPLYEHGALFDEVLSLLADEGMSVVQIEPGFLDERSGQLLQADVLLMRLGPSVHP